MKGGTTTAGIMRPPDGWAWLLRKARKAFGTSMFGVSLRAPLLITKSRCLSPRSPPMAQIDGRLPWRMCAAGSGVELATAAGCTTRGRAPLARHSPCRKDNDEWSFAINVEKGKMVFASHTAAVVGERGVRAPRAAALGRSPRPLLRGSSKERCLALEWWVLRCPEASPQVCLASRSAPGVTPWRRQQVGSGAAPRARTRGGGASAPPEPPPRGARSARTMRDMLYERFRSFWVFQERHSYFCFGTASALDPWRPWRAPSYLRSCPTAKRVVWSSRRSRSVACRGSSH